MTLKLRDNVIAKLQFLVHFLSDLLRLCPSHIYILLTNQSTSPRPLFCPALSFFTGLSFWSITKVSVRLPPLVDFARSFYLAYDGSQALCSGEHYLTVTVEFDVKLRIANNGALAYYRLARAVRETSVQRGFICPIELVRQTSLTLQSSPSLCISPLPCHTLLAL